MFLRFPKGKLSISTRRTFLALVIVLMSAYAYVTAITKENYIGELSDGRLLLFSLKFNSFMELGVTIQPRMAR